MSKKIFYLFLALLLPGLIFVFLKYFGRNEFDIPVFYSDGIGDSLSVCKIKSKGQYHISDSAFSRLKCNNCGSLLIVDGHWNEAKALSDKAKLANIEIVFLKDILSDEEVDLFRKCVLFMKPPWDVVLVDEQRRIRGYYKLGHRDEMDRLEVELKILLKKY